MVITNGDVQVAVSWAETDTTAVVRARATEGVVRLLGLVAEVVDDFRDVRDVRHRRTHFHAHHDVVVTTVSAVVAARAGVQIDVTVRIEFGVNSDTLNACLTIAEQIVFGL